MTAEFVEAMRTVEELRVGLAPPPEGWQSRRRFAVWLFALVVEAAGALGAQVMLDEHDGEMTADPGTDGLSGPLRAWPPTARIEFPACAVALEAQVGGRARGRSGVEHSCDVLIVPEPTARFCREAQRAIDGNAVACAIVAAFASCDPLPLARARATLGLACDLSNETVVILASTQDNPAAARLLAYHGGRRGLYSCVSGHGGPPTEELRMALRAILSQWAVERPRSAGGRMR